MTSALFLAAVLFAGPNTSNISLAELAANPPAYEGRQVTACGWALNRFEGHSLSVSRHDDGRGTGIVVDWLSGEPPIPDWSERCVTGVVEKVCADADHAASDGMQAICVGPDWSLRQTILTAEAR